MQSTESRKSVRTRFLNRHKSEAAAKEAETQRERAKRLQQVKAETSGALSGGEGPGIEAWNAPQPDLIESPPLAPTESDVPPPPLSLPLDDHDTEQPTISRPEEDLRKEEEQHTQCQEKLEAAESRRDELEKALADARRELLVAIGADNEDEFQRHEQTRDRLMGELDEAHKECEALRKALKESRARIDELEKESWEMKRENQKMQREHDMSSTRGAIINPENLENQSLRSSPPPAPSSYNKTSGEKGRPSQRMIGHKRGHPYSTYITYLAT